MRSIIVLSLLALTGCASNPYKKFYTDQTGGADLSTLPVIIENEDPKAVTSTDPTAASHDMLQNGFAMLGYSSFTGPSSDGEDALKFGKAIHASVVVVFSKYLSTASGSMPITTPTTQTSYTNFNAYGSRGNVYGSGTTTTYGSQTNYIPYSVDRYEHGAQYWIKMKPKVFGAMVKDISEEKRKKLSTNKGAEIYIVIKGTPCFNADFMEGDVIKKIDDKEVVDAKTYQSALEGKAGKSVSIEFYRDGKPLSKVVQLNERSS